MLKAVPKKNAQISHYLDPCYDDKNIQILSKLHLHPGCIFFLFENKRRQEERSEPALEKRIPYIIICRLICFWNSVCIPTAIVHAFNSFVTKWCCFAAKSDNRTVRKGSCGGSIWVLVMRLVRFTLSIPKESQMNGLAVTRWSYTSFSLFVRHYFSSVCLSVSILLLLWSIIGHWVMENANH